LSISELKYPKPLKPNKQTLQRIANILSMEKLVISNTQTCLKIPRKKVLINGQFPGHLADM